jgi:hypothetical protein
MTWPRQAGRAEPSDFPLFRLSFVGKFRTGLYVSSGGGMPAMLGFLFVLV